MQNLGGIQKQPNATRGSYRRLRVGSRTQGKKTPKQVFHQVQLFQFHSPDTPNLPKYNSKYASSAPQVLLEGQSQIVQHLTYSVQSLAKGGPKADPLRGYRLQISLFWSASGFSLLQLGRLKLQLLS